MKKPLLIVIGLVAAAALIFAGVTSYQRYSAENKEKERADNLAAIDDLYIDREKGYFKEGITSESFDLLSDQLGSQRDNKEIQDLLSEGKENINLQSKINNLFEEPVLDGINLSAHPTLDKPADKEIEKLSQSIDASSAKDTSWGQDMAMILSLAKTQSASYTDATNKINQLVQNGKVQSDITLSGYLEALRSLSFLADGNYKKALNERLKPAENYLSQTNQDFAQQVAASESEAEAAVAAYNQEIQRKLQGKRNQLSDLEKTLEEKNRTYTSLVRKKQSIEDSEERDRRSSESSASRSSSTRSSESSSSTSSNDPDVSKSSEETPPNND